jgi:hypothetical protein
MAYFTKGFILCWILSFAILVGSLYFWANQSYETTLPQVANKTEAEIEVQRETLTVPSVFLNNLSLSLYLLVPLCGLIPFFYIWYNTAKVIGLLALAYQIPPITYVLLLTFLVFFEFAAYATLMAENIYLIFLLLSRSGKASERLRESSWKSFILYLILLLLGAITEVLSIG